MLSNLGSAWHSRPVVARYVLLLHVKRQSTVCSMEQRVLTVLPVVFDPCCFGQAKLGIYWEAILQAERELVSLLGTLAG